MKKRILIVVLAGLLIFTVFALEVSAASSYSWHIKRNKGGTPRFPEEAKIIKEYDVYYLDEPAAREGKKIIYLTFDVGYENGNVERILDVLKKESVPGAFFILDNLLLKNTNLVKRMFDEGHLVCNHTKNHKNLSNSTPEEIARNLSALEMLCEERCGREMAKYFRYPEGCYSLESVKYIQNLGYKTIFWSFAYDDWDNNRQPKQEKAIKKILDNTHCGAVMLFHPTSKTNADIFEKLIQEWKSQGYSFGTLDQLTEK